MSACAQCGLVMPFAEIETHECVDPWDKVEELEAEVQELRDGLERKMTAKANIHKICEDAGTLALRTLKSGMMAGLTSQARPWFQLTVGSDPKLADYAPVKQWLFEVQDSMRRVFSRSNLYQVLPALYESLGAYGTAANVILEDEKSVIRCYPFPVGQFAIALDHRGCVDTLMRNFTMTVRQLVQQFGKENCSASVRMAYDSGSYEEHIEVLHSIGPSPWRDQGKLTAKDKPFHDIYLELGSDGDTLLQESGFDEFPAQCPRWDVGGDDVYGYSPGMDALGDVKELQLTVLRKADIKNKLSRPPLLADESLRGKRTSLLAGDITYQSNLASMQHAGIRPMMLVVPEAINVLEASERELEARIKRVFYEDLMLMFATGDDPTMTAREVSERHDEKMLVLGPVMERLNCELLDPIIDRTFNIMLRRGMIPPPPREVQGQLLQVDYISIMAQAQKLIGVSGLQQFFAFVGNLAQIKPEVLDKIDGDHGIDEAAAMFGISPKIVITDDAVQEVRAGRAKAQQMQQMMQAAPAMSQAATAAKTMAEIPIDTPNALGRLMGAA